MTSSTHSTDAQTRLLTLFVSLALPLAACGPAGAADNEGGNSQNDGIEQVRSSQKRVSNPEVSDETVDKLTGDNASFAFDLYEQLASENSDSNFFYSPHSISSALAMVYAGAEGSSETQMREALRYELPEKDLHPAFNKLDQELESRAQESNGSQQSGTPFELRIANSVWGQREFPFEDSFLDTLARHYGAGVRTVKFQSEPEAAREAINGWVARKTEENIEEMLSSKAVDPNTRMVLTNAIYFQANWANKFDEANTEQADFTTGSGETVQVPMMRLEQKPVDPGPPLTHASGANWKAVELPYVGNKVSMVVLVPDRGKFSAVEAKLSGDWVDSEIFANLSDDPIDVQMPKFDVESKFSAKKMLKALGMKAPFGDANLTGMSQAGNLTLSDVLHESFVAVDEKGTEAAAATAAPSSVSAPEFINVRVDRPFIFMIRDRETDAVLFAGRVVDPT